MSPLHQAVLLLCALSPAVVLASTSGGPWVLVAQSWIDSFAPAVPQSWLARGRFVTPNVSRDIGNWREVRVECGKEVSGGDDTTHAFSYVLPDKPTDCPTFIGDQNNKCGDPSLSEWHPVGQLRTIIRAPNQMQNDNLVHCNTNYASFPSNSQADNPEIGQWGRVWVQLAQEESSQPVNIVSAQCSGMGAPAPDRGGAGVWNARSQELRFSWPLGVSSGSDICVCQPVTCELTLDRDYARLTGRIVESAIPGEESNHPDDDALISEWNQIVGGCKGYIAVGTPNEFITQGTGFSGSTSFMTATLATPNTFDFDQLFAQASNTLRISSCQNTNDENFRLNIEQLNGVAMNTVDSLEDQLSASSAADKIRLGRVGLCDVSGFQLKQWCQFRTL